MYKFRVNGEFCPVCMENFVSKARCLDGVKNISFNQIDSSMSLELSGENDAASLENVKKLLKTVESGAVLDQFEEDGKKDFGVKKKSLKDFLSSSKPELIKLAIAAAVIFAANLKLFGSVRIYVYALAACFLGGELFLSAAKKMLSKQFFEEEFLMSVAVVAAFALGEYLESVMVLIFFNMGEMLENYATEKSKASITELIDLKQDYANVVSGSDIKKISPEDVAVGSEIAILPGEKVPLDCIVASGSTRLDTSSITGESVPVYMKAGDELLSGYLNLESAVNARVIRDFKSSAVSQIMDIAKLATEKKSSSEKFITKFSKYYTPVVLMVAAFTAFGLPALGFGSYKDFVYRALSFLVVACPCAIIISVPLAYFAGVGAASSHGILVKGNIYLEELKNMAAAVFDKTGTLTTGNFGVSGIICRSDYNEEKLIKTLAYIEANSNHPLAKTLVAYYGGKIDRNEIKEFKEIAGAGVSAEVFGVKMAAGNINIFELEGLDKKLCDTSSEKTVVYLIVDGDYKGYVAFSDELKAGSKEAIKALKAMNIKTYMLTGDKESPASKVAGELGIDEYYSELRPEEKLYKLEEIMDKTAGTAAFAGDGINDAPAIKRSDVGIAMGAAGQDASIEAADVIIATDNPKKIVEAVKISKITDIIVKENIYFSIGVKMIIMLLSAFGITGLGLAVFGDVGVSIIAIMNSARISSKKI